MKPSTIALLLALLPLPAAAHGQALLFAISQLGLYVAIVALAPILSAKGDRLWNFLATLIGYPVVFFLVPAATYSLFQDSRVADKAWEIVMYVVWVCVCVALVGVRVYRSRFAA